jgi:hypothetical protein
MPIPEFAGDCGLRVFEMGEKNGEGSMDINK